MNPEEIIEMARSIDPQSWAQQHPDDDEWCIKFAKLVEDAAFKRWAAQTKLAVQNEREACAKVCEDIFNAPEPDGCAGEDYYYTRPFLICAAAIKAKS